MSARTNTRTEYAPMGLTKEGVWRPLGSARFPSLQVAQDAMKEYVAYMERLGDKFGRPRAYKVMKRTVSLTVTEWEEAEA